MDLSWSLDSSGEIERFMVEHQRGDAWATVGMVQASAARNTYRFRAPDMTSGEQTFRLRAINTDGMTVFSEPVMSGMDAGASTSTTGE